MPAQIIFLVFLFSVNSNQVIWSDNFDNFDNWDNTAGVSNPSSSCPSTGSGKCVRFGWTGLSALSTKSNVNITTVGYHHTQLSYKMKTSGIYVGFCRIQFKIGNGGWNTVVSRGCCRNIDESTDLAPIDTNIDNQPSNIQFRAQASQSDGFTNACYIDDIILSGILITNSPTKGILYASIYIYI